MIETVTSLKNMNKRLARRIHNQRVQLRETWEIVDMRIQAGAHAAFRPLRTKWVDYGFSQTKKLKTLRKRIADLEKEVIELKARRMVDEEGW